MANITTAFVFVLMLNIFLFMTQISMIENNPESYTKFYSGDGSLLEKFSVSYNYTNPSLNTGDSVNQLPSATKEVDPDTGNFFTDIFNTGKDWVTQKAGLDYFYAVLSAPYNMLKLANLPQGLVFAIGTLWYVITLFLFVAFLIGRDT